MSDNDSDESNEENKRAYRVVEVDDEDSQTRRINDFSFNHGNNLFLQIR